MGGTCQAQARSAGNFFWSCSSTFLALQLQLVVLASAFVMVNTVLSLSCFFFLFFYSRCHRAQPFVKVWARAPVPYGVEVPFVEQFHTKKHYKTVFAFKVMHRVTLLTRFCKLLTRVAILSGGGARASYASMARRL